MVDLVNSVALVSSRMELGVLSPEHWSCRLEMDNIALLAHGMRCDKTENIVRDSRAAREW